MPRFSNSAKPSEKGMQCLSTISRYCCCLFAPKKERSPFSVSPIRDLGVVDPEMLRTQRVSPIVAVFQPSHSSIVRGEGRGGYDSPCRCSIIAFGNCSNGQLGNGGSESNVQKPKLLSSLRRYNIVHIACASTHSIAITDNGIILSCGSDDYGELGRAGNPMKFGCIESLETFKIIQAAAGRGFTSALTDDGRVLSWGRNEFGELGRGDSPASSCPRFVLSLDEAFIVRLCSGESHTVALSRSGEVYSWGSNSCGQLGIGHTRDSFVPILVQAIKGCPIVDISCGSSHSIVLSASGNAYSWGSNQFGQLGLGHKDASTSPKSILSLRLVRLISVAAGGYHTLFLSSQGRVFSCGAGSNFQLGNESQAGDLFPAMIYPLRDIPITSISCGDRHSIVYSKALRKFYSFGLNSSGQLGTGDLAIHAQLMPFYIDEAFENVSLFCGGNQSFIVSADYSLTQYSILRLNSPQIFSAIDGIEASAGDKDSLVALHKTIVTGYASASVLNASFLLEGNEDKSPLVTERSSGIDIVAVRLTFERISSMKTASTIAHLAHATTILTSSLLTLPQENNENLRVFQIVLENVLMMDVTSHSSSIRNLIRALHSLPLSRREILFGWYRYQPSVYFLRAVSILQTFVTYTKKTKDPTDSIWEALRLLDVLYQLNEEWELLPHTVFYNDSIANFSELQQDYHDWRRAPTSLNFCKFPFLLDLKAKITLLRTESKQHMAEAVFIVLQSFLSSFARGILPNPEHIPFYFVLSIRRSNMVEDTMKIIVPIALRNDGITIFRKPLQVNFIGEEGVDAGGVQKEFFQLIVRELLDPNGEHQLFSEEEDFNTVWFYYASQYTADKLRKYFLLGALIGMATYNGVMLSLNFPSILYKKLTQRSLGLRDLKTFRPSVGSSLEEMLSCKESIADIYMSTFQIAVKTGANVVAVNLKNDGESIPVTNASVREFVDRYCNFIFNESINKPYASLVEGLKCTMDGAAFLLFRSDELELLITGSPKLEDISELKRVTTYLGGYTASSSTIVHFWEIVAHFSQEIQRRLLFFVTGSDRIPYSGLSSLRFCIQRCSGDSNRLPTAHTCFNTIDLPAYSSKQKLEKLLLVALENCEGFGFA